MELTRQIVFIGLIDGLSIGLLALGIVLIYRSSRVINFAVGNIGSLSAAVLALLVINYGWPFWPALAVASLLGAVFAAVMEATVVTRLFRAPRVILLVATIGIAQLAQLFQVALPDIEADFVARYPTPLSGRWTVLGVRVTGPELLVLVVVPVLAVGLTVFLTRTDTGKAVRAAAANPERARLSAISPKLLSTLVWTIAGLLSSVSLVLLAGTAGSLTTLATLGPSTLVRVLAAALIGSMTSFPRALAGGVAIGVAQAFIRFNWPTQVGLVDALLLVVVVVATWAVSRHAVGDDDDSFSFAPRTRPVPDRLRQIWWVRRGPTLVAFAALVVAIALPLVVTASSRQFLYSRMLLLALLSISLVVLTGWSGQVSIGQAAFAGIGALGAAALVDGRPLGLGVGGFDVVVTLPELHFAVALVVVTAVSAAAAVVVGAGALRVRGLLLAVVTLSFALAAQQYLWRRPFFSDGNTSTVLLKRARLGPVDLSDQRTYYYLSLTVLVAVMVVVGRLRRSGVGRTMIGVRDNAASAAAYTVSPTRTKLTAFALAGGIAGLAGGMLGGLLATISFTEVFTVTDSIEVVSIAVIGGVGSVAGPVLGSLWVIGLPAFWPDNAVVPLLTSSLGLLILLMYFPGGLVQIGYGARGALLGWAERRLGEAAPEQRSAAVPAAPTASRTRSPLEGAVVETERVSVRFGGRVAVDAVDLTVRAGEIVGLIGTNGAGKTTLMNAIGGFVPAEGTVRLLGHDISAAPPAARARLGLGRTFQAARLFPDLSVRETLQVALEARHRTGFWSTALFLPTGTRIGRAQQTEADEILHFLGLARYGDHFVADLSTGTRRILELACLLALDARVLCLDEPTAGVAQRETEAFGPLIRRIRDELDASLLVIEHDMPLIMGISDRVYCLEAGKVIAVGAPADVRAAPEVIASYLGTDERAILRSGVVPDPEAD